MNRHQDFDTVADAVAVFDHLRELQAQGHNVRQVNMSERGVTYLTVFPNEKPYVVSWHEWVD